MKTPGRANTVLSEVVSPSPSAPPSKIRTASSAQTARALLAAPGMTAFRLVDSLQVEPVDADPLCTQGEEVSGGGSIVKSSTVAASVPPPGAVAFQWSVRRNVNENRISPE